MTPTDARRYVNPHQRDVLVLLESSAESRGERTLAELEVLPGGRVTPHRHRSYTEHFHVLEGRLQLHIDDERLEVTAGEEVTVPAGALHAWANEGGERALALIELRPGQTGFETALRVAYGLAGDGRVLANGMPRNPLHAALLLRWGDGELPGLYAALDPIFRLLAAIARRAGVERRLLLRYPDPTRL